MSTDDLRILGPSRSVAPRPGGRRPSTGAPTPTGGRPTDSTGYDRIGPSARNVRNGGSPCSAVLIVLIPTVDSYGRALTGPGNDALSIRSVEWLRDHHFRWAVNDVENYWYTPPPAQEGRNRRAPPCRPRWPAPRRRRPPARAPPASPPGQGHGRRRPGATPSCRPRPPIHALSSPTRCSGRASGGRSAGPVQRRARPCTSPTCDPTPCTPAWWPPWPGSTPSWSRRCSTPGPSSPAARGWAHQLPI